MPYRLTPDLIENDNVEVSENAAGETVITDKTSGESVSLGPDGVGANSISSNSLNTTKFTSTSLPKWRIYQDGAETVAVDDTTTEIARAEDAATVWQAATDAANDVYDPTQKEIPAAIIDGGGLEYAINSTVTFLNGAIVKNARFDMSSAASNDLINVGGPDTGFSNGGIHLRNIVVLSNPSPVTFWDLVYSHIGPFLIRDSLDRAATFYGPIGCDINMNVKNVGGSGVVFDGGGHTENYGNSNRIELRTNSCDGVGIHNKTLRNTVFNKAIGEACTGHGIVDGGHGCLWLAPTTEVNDLYGFYSNATNGQYIIPHSNNDTDGGFRFTGLSQDCRLQGPIRGNGDVSESASAVGNIIDRVDSADFSTVIGARTLVNGWGTNEGDPSVEGEWNTFGREGVIVRDTTGNQNFVFINGSWEQL